MFTICPKCALTLVVTAADLRVAQGHVRCGRCSSVFNALARLTEERQAAGTEPPPSSASSSLPPLPPGPLLSEPPPSPQGAAAPADEPAIPEEALEFNPATTSAESVFVQPRPDPQWEAATGSFKAMVAANQEPVRALDADQLVEVEIDSGFLSEIIKASERSATPASAPAPPAAPSPSPSPAPSPAPAVADAPAHEKPRTSRQARDADVNPRAALARTREEPEAESFVEPEPLADADTVRVVPRPTAREREPLATVTDAHDDAPEPASRPPYPWIFGIAGAALLLIAQIVNHYRDDLATSPGFSRPLTAVYHALGVTLKPRWDLHAYDVRQLGASVDSANAGEITVRASIKNTGSQPQPLPLLRVTLLDRFGTPLAARDVQPQFYVPGAVPAAALLGAGQRIDAEMAFLDPGASAVGFELDACLPAAGGGTACANDAAAVK
jgi:predicted Zn finger-like uncharacterized protein